MNRVLLGAVLASSSLVAALARAQAAPDAPAAALPAADPAVRAAIDLLLRAMEQAILAGDKDAYLALVSREDTEFLHEQTYFANDLTKKKPAAVSLALGELSQGDGSVAGPLTWTWTMTGDNAKERSVTFDVRFVEVEGDWRYAGETWERHEAPGVIVYHDEGLDELAARTVEAFSAVRPGVEACFGLGHDALPKRTQKIKLYGSMKHLQQSICLSYTDGLGGWNEPGESIKLLAGRRATLPSLKSLLAHEYGHVATFELGPKSNNMAWWILEGVAELSAQEVAGGGKPDRTVLRWARSNKLVDWPLLSDFENCKPEHQGFVYTQGHHMMNYITSRVGREGRNAWMRAQSTGRTIDDATREVMQLSFADLDAAWRADLAEKVAKAKEAEGKEAAEKEAAAKKDADKDAPAPDAPAPDAPAKDAPKQPD